jgi:hypothetical protein
VEVFLAFSEDNQNWIREEIRKAINPNGWKKAANWLRYWGVLGFCITFFVGLLAIVTTLGIFTTNRISQESEFRGTTTQQLKTIEQRLTTIDNALDLLRAQAAVQKYSSVALKELQVHTEELKQIKSTLAKLPPTSPGYWPAAFQIVTLLSRAQFQLETVGKRPLSIMHDVHFAPAPGPRIVLRNKNVLLEREIEGVHFENSVIHFDPSVKLRNDTFVNCVFILPAQENPPKSFQEIGSILLTSDLSTVAFNAS